MDMGIKPIANLSGHSLDQYTIHAGKTVPNMWSIGSFDFSEDEAYALIVKGATSDELDPIKTLSFIFVLIFSGHSTSIIEFFEF